MTHAPLTGNHVFGRDSCPYTLRAKSDLAAAGIPFSYHNVLVEELLQEMQARVRPLIEPTARITVPQIWLEGKYIGGSDDLRKKLGLNQEEDSPPFCPI